MTNRKICLNITLLCIYFIVRIPILFIVSTNVQEQSWINSPIQFAYFLTIALLIINNRKNLDNYHLDRFSVVIIFLFVTIFRARIIENSSELIIELLFILSAVLFLAVLIKEKPNFLSYSLLDKWNGKAILAGLTFSYVIILFHPVLRTGEFVYGNDVYVNFIKIFFVEIIAGVGGIGVAGIFEEPIYRGFLWGTLHDLGWQEKKIWLAQALLYWVSHLNYLHESPYTFWVITPLMGLLLGFLAWRSKSIVPAIFTHVIVNSILKTYQLFLLIQ